MGVVLRMEREDILIIFFVLDTALQGYHVVTKP